VTLGPWLVWVPLLALLNLLLFIAVRGRWGRIVWALAGASAAGVVIGDAIGGALGIGLLRIGDMHVLSASVAAQVFMVAATLLAALGPVEIREP
jgi:hypothetical protein